MVDRSVIYKSVDDSLMKAATCEELEILIPTFFKQCKLHNVKILKKKFQLDTEIVFGGVEFDGSAESIIFAPQNSKLEEIREFKSPKTKKELQSFLGVVATFHRWNPNISRFSEKLCHLNAKGVHFSGEKDWTPELEEEFQKLKSEIETAFKKKPFEEK